MYNNSLKAVIQSFKKLNPKSLASHWFCIGLFTLAVSEANAQKIYSLQSCIDTAMQKNLNIKAVQFDLEKSYAGVKQSVSNYLPNVNLSASYQYQFEIPTSILPADAFGGATDGYMAAQMGVEQSKSIAAQLNQNIFNMPALTGIKIARISGNLSALQIKSTKEDLVYNISTVYYNIQSIQKQIEFTTQTLSNTESLLKITEKQWKAGLATSTDQDRLTVSRDNTGANLESLQNSKVKLYNLLKLFMNVPLDRDISIEELNENDINLTLIINTDFNPEAKTNIQQLNENEHMLALQRKSITTSYLPTISLIGNYQYAGYYYDVNPTKNINDKWYSSSYIGINLSLPVFDGLNRHQQIRQKNFEIEKTKVQKQQLILQNQKEVFDANADLKSNYLTFMNQQRNLSLAQKVMDDINTQYNSGLVRITDVINTETELKSAQNNYVNALINFKKAELDVKKAQGQLIQ
ncbi:MAG: TolC family protein [Breznakibacter sp.]